MARPRTARGMADRRHCQRTIRWNLCTTSSNAVRIARSKREQAVNRGS